MPTRVAIRSRLALVYTKTKALTVTDQSLFPLPRLPAAIEHGWNVARVWIFACARVFACAVWRQRARRALLPLARKYKATINSMNW